jgi:holliday junction DNA helicase RuvA
MISHLSGKLTQAWPTQVIVEVGGVGYEVLIPLNSFDRLPKPPAPIKLLTHLVVREDSHQLYGFLSEEERDLFRMLIQKVSGIGPKTALDVLGGISAADFKSAVINSDSARLSAVKGIGRKTAERIILELKDKLGVAGAWETASKKGKLSIEDQTINDAVLALISLGYKQVDALKCVREARGKSSAKVTVESLVYQALRSL